MDRLGRRQVAANATSRNQWEEYSEHRVCVTAVLSRQATVPGSRLCVLGAGNANDLDLTTLLSVHREVHLVDIDFEALSGAAQRQGVAQHPRLRLQGGVDVTATLGLLSDCTPNSELGPADFDAMAAWPASRVAVVLPGGFDRVASSCMLTQILETATHSLGTDHRQLPEARAALLAGHLRLLARLAAPGGDVVLVSEVTSSEMLAELPALKKEQLAGLLTKLGRNGDHFRGVHPRQLLSTLRADSSLRPLITDATAFTPWRWRLHDVTYLVGAIGFRLATG
jgi:hypothetical protein